MTKKEFIKKCNINRPNEKYDFSLVPENIRKYDRVKIKCLIHNVIFEFNGFDFCRTNKIVCPECKIDKLTKDFISKSKAVWGDDAFDYSKTRYVNTGTNVILICKKHNIEFEQNPQSHLKHITGCPYCRNKTGIYSKETFIEYFEKKYPGLYDYSLVEYIDNSTPVKIICKKHNHIFEITTYKFMQRGCPLCGRENKVHEYTQDEFIEKALLICESYFDLSLVEYKGIYVPVKVICPIHGIIEITPKSILNGVKCKYCQGKAKYTTETFVQQLILNRGTEHFDYSLVNYVNQKIKVKIICKVHNEVFEVNPSNFLQGSGCPICSRSKKHTNETFIEEALKIQGNVYDYSEVNYVNNRTPVKIICKIHGPFMQTPHNHLQGQGCPLCNKNHKIE